ncbi:hypothetical protein BD324DRAFT_624898 [Kockovaella imperatae]|uniref:DASH complex subunit SPC19 n=1 Tax=Kockovaella imperatae TaxID=4999 RepID=A0A1Y1UGM9_9TREE|nr:hypothetical protein BD324DRAFT_624898 [Kockovaella imperatae]ORX37129.1 hypothetical protein BD324DRAFT_624898 [Kockovaella imperatae]
MPSTLARESMYPTASTSTLPSFDFLHSLDSCVEITKECTTSLGRGLDMFKVGVEDMPRLAKVLTNRQHFLLLPHPTISSYQSTMSTTMAPHIQDLISRAERALQAQSDVLANMEQKLDILSSAEALSAIPPAAPSLSPGSTAAAPSSAYDRTSDSSDHEDGTHGRTLDSLEIKELNPAQRRAVVVLKNKRKRLEEEKKRLERGIGA